MKANRVYAVARKEFLHVLRDPRSLGMAIAMPLLMLFLFGYALTLDVDRVRLAIWDQSNTPQSREYISRFIGSRYFSAQQPVETYRQAEAAIDARAVTAALVLPVTFGSDLSAGRSATAQFLVDGSDPMTATLALGYAEAVTQGFGGEVLLQRTRRSGQPVPRGGVEVVPRVWYNPELQSRNFIVPGLIAVIMVVIAALLTSLTVAREWETGTMEQLISTPVTPTELILGKLSPYFSIGMLDVLLAVVMGRYLFDVPLRGSPALLFAMAALFLGGALGQGILISIVTKSQLVANQLAIMSTFLPAFLLSGFTFAISNMPDAIQYFTQLIFTRYFITLLRGIYLKGIGLELLWMEAVLLGLFTCVILLVARMKFRKRLA